jgi:hypothetical protein
MYMDQGVAGRGPIILGGIRKKGIVEILIRASSLDDPLHFVRDTKYPGPTLPIIFPLGTPKARAIVSSKLCSNSNDWSAE